MITTVSADNIQSTRNDIPCDQASELCVGCHTWPIYLWPGNQRGQITVWPNDRAGICFGGDTIWGFYRDATNSILADDGAEYSSEGEMIQEATEGY